MIDGPTLSNIFPADAALSLQQLWRYAMVLLGGMLLGLFFYGGLWWTVRRVLTARQPGLLSLASFMVRTVVTIAGLYLITRGSIDRIVVSMVGLLLVRMVLVGRLGPQPEVVDPRATRLGKERARADHAG